MTDLALRYDDRHKRFDLVLDGDTPALGPDLETAVLASLFTWRRSDPSDLLPDGADGNRQGWFGDAWPERENMLTGCRWWLLTREIVLPETIARARAYLQEALRWLVDDDIADRVEVDVYRSGVNAIGARVEIHQPGGSVWVRTYQDIWQMLGRF